MRISDWSSDVCSSDLILRQLQQDRADKRPVVLATFLNSGEQRLLYLQGKKGLKDIDPRIGEAARAALLEDKPRTIDTEQGPLFLNVFNPPLRLVLVGAVHIAQALEIGRASGRERVGQYV